MKPHTRDKIRSGDPRPEKIPGAEILHPDSVSNNLFLLYLYP